MFTSFFFFSINTVHQPHRYHCPLDYILLLWLWGRRRRCTIQFPRGKNSTSTLIGCIWFDYWAFQMQLKLSWMSELSWVEFFSKATLFTGLGTFICSGNSKVKQKFQEEQGFSNCPLFLGIKRVHFLIGIFLGNLHCTWHKTR